MMPHGAAHLSPAKSAKWRWRWFLAAALLALVVFSLLLHLFVLVGLHNVFPYGHVKQNQLARSEPNLGLSVSSAGSLETNSSQVEGEDSRIDKLVENFATAIVEQQQKENLTSQFRTSEINDSSVEDGNYTTPYQNPSSNIRTNTSGELLDLNKTGAEQNENRTQQQNLPSGGENVKSCEVEFGSYCLWSEENKEIMKDSIVKRVKDQMFVARAYYPTIAKLTEMSELAVEMKQRIQDHEQMLSKAISDPDLPKFVGELIEKMDETIVKAKSCKIDCHNVDNKLRQLLDMTEDEARFHMKQGAFLYQLDVQTLPKTHHCLAMRLTLEYFNSSSENLPVMNVDKLEDPDLKHYVMFSRSIISTSVTVNSTVMNSKDPEDIVFHLFTDQQNFYAFRSWFSRKSYKNASFHIHQMDDQKLSPSEEFRISFRSNTENTLVERTEYLSVFGHSHFALPDLLENISKVVVLDEDVVVQSDLSSLWNFDLGGNVIGAVQFCGVRLGQIKEYLGKFRYDANSCAWMSGLNIVDLKKWRESDIGSIYKGLLQSFEGVSEESWRIGTLRASLLAFQDLVHPLPIGWVQSGLGHNYRLTHGRLRKALALHFDGNMKPWLHLGIPRYKKYWRKYLPRDEPFMGECNLNP